MKQNKNHNDNTLSPQLIEKYLNGALSSTEMNRVEKLMLNSGFDAEAMEGFEGYSGSMKSDIDKLKTKVDQLVAPKKKSSGLWLKVAASLVILATAIIMIFNVDWVNEPKLAKSNQENNDASLPAIEQQDAPEETVFDSLLAYENLKEESESPEAASDVSSSNTDKSQERDVPKATESFSENGVPEQMVGNRSAKKPQELESISDMEEFPEMSPVKRDSNLALNIEDQLAGKVAGVTITRQKAESIRVKGVASIPERKIRGKITDEDGSPIVGANIILRGTGIGSTSDIEGNYTVTIPLNMDSTLVYSFIGYDAQEITVAGNEIDVQLAPDVQALSEVVVVGYGQQDDSGVSVVSAEPVTGKSGFKAYIKKNMRYPVGQNSKGKVILSFTVLANGSLADFKIIRSLGTDFDKEAIRLIREGPAWTPATRNGTPETDDVRVRIKFDPDN